MTKKFLILNNKNTFYNHKECTFVKPNSQIRSSRAPVTAIMGEKDYDM